MQVFVRNLMVVLAAIAIGIDCAKAEEKPYTEGPVWILTFV